MKNKGAIPEPKTLEKDTKLSATGLPDLRKKMSHEVSKQVKEEFIKTYAIKIHEDIMPKRNKK